MFKIDLLGEKAKKAAAQLGVLSSQQKNKALENIANALIENADIILSENKKDIENAIKNKISKSLIDRLMLTNDRIKQIAKGVLDIVALDDPVLKVLEQTTRPNGLKIKKVSVPLGVIGIIYEARPNVTVDAAALCLKAGNCCILRGGKEAINSNIAFSKIMREAIEKAGIDKNAISVIEDISRDSAVALMKANEYIDVLIPRGGAGLIKSTVENATVPVIETGTGNCHVYIDEFADIDMGVSIAFNSKTQRVSVCNTCESLLVHSAVAKEFLPKIKARFDEKNVIIYGCEKTRQILKDIEKAAEEDYYAEYLDYKISVKIVDSLDEAILHINKYGTHHSDCIVSNSNENCNEFLNKIDSACVYTNASTRFTDGFEFGFGAEIGISTQKVHARGPMGLKELTTYKYIVEGNGQLK